MDDTRTVKRIWFKRPVSGRKRGKPKKGWSVAMMEDIREWKISNYRKKAKNREEWRKEKTMKL